jgi:polar amino acid transport system permease protein
MYQWDWRLISVYKFVFLQGALVTLWLTFIAVILGTVLGVIIAFMKKSRNPIFSLFAKGYIELFRAVPILVLIIWVFYVIPILLNWRVSAFTAAIMALSINLAAFVAETVRAAIESIPNSQYESGQALGMTHRQIMFHIIIPQAIRNMIPNLMGLYVSELKNSSLASVIAVNELLHRSNILISETYRPLEIYTTVAVVYLIMIMPLGYLARVVEQHFSKSDKPTLGMEMN